VAQPLTQTRTKSDIVSSETERLILVDADDQAVGELDKSACHDADGVLHRAFSAFVFNAAGQLLLQRRASGKRLWPDTWSNSCCSHPRAGEVLEDAVTRRVEQELGLRIDAEFIYKFQYHARYRDIGSERELCSVFLGCSTQTPVINTNEIGAWRWIDAAALDTELAQPDSPFTPWLRLEWASLRSTYADRLRTYGVAPLRQDAAP
jgi:isopentenyl-diphosphate delta-isomerase